MQYTSKELKLLRDIAGKVAAKVHNEHGQAITADYVRKIWKSENIPKTPIAKRVLSATNEFLKLLK